MSATTVGALLIFVVAAILFWAIKTAPERRERSLTPLQDAYSRPQEEDETSADETT